MKKVWQALSDENRRQILTLLRKKDMSAGEIAEHFDTTKPTISHHLNVLRDVGLIVATHKAQTIIYSLNTSIFDGFMQSIAEFFFAKEKVI